jgi:hypothetical protein
VAAITGNGAESVYAQIGSVVAAVVVTDGDVSVFVYGDTGKMTSPRLGWICSANSTLR